MTHRSSTRAAARRKRKDKNKSCSHPTVALVYVELYLGRIHTAALEPALRLVGRNTWEGTGKACELYEKFYKVFNRGRA